MEVYVACCCGLDVHKASIEACILDARVPGQVAVARARFGTHTEQLRALAEWLADAGVTHVAMESTGVYWKPVHNILESQCEVWVVNAQHVRSVPGRKTDCQDAEWLARLLQHGLLRPSFVPDRFLRELRDLTRTRTGLRDTRGAVANRIQALLEDANLKLGNVATDILGISSRAILTALVEGVTDPHALSQLARGRLRRKQAALVEALTGLLRDHHRVLLGICLEQVAQLDEQIERLSQLIADRCQPYDALLNLWDSIPGVDRTVAEILLAEIGPDMSQFDSAMHLASWAAMCPGQHESAGKRKGGKTRKGSPWLRRALVQAAHAAARTKREGYTAFADYHRRLIRRGKPPQKAAVAVGHRILVTAYHMARDGTMYHEPSAAELAEHRAHRIRDRALQQLRSIGYSVTLSETALVT